MSFSYTLEGQTYPDWNLTFALSDEVTDMDALEGLAVEQDPTAANTVKLATDGGKIVGFILIAENGKNQGEGITVTVAMKGGFKVKTSAQLSVGDYVCGAGNGAVKASMSSDATPVPVPTDVQIWEVRSASEAVALKA